MLYNFTCCVKHEKATEHGIQHENLLLFGANHTQEFKIRNLFVKKFSKRNI